MEDDYKTKKNDVISKAFIDLFVAMSGDYIGYLDELVLIYPVYQNPKTLDKFTILW